MAGSGEIAQLEERRRLLVAESDCLRQQFAGDLMRVQATAVWVDRGYSVFKSLRSYWPILATAAGFLMARKKGARLRLVGKLWAYWRILKKVAGLWRSYSRRKEKE